jgi:hypothetical protein
MPVRGKVKLEGNNKVRQKKGGKTTGWLMDTG